MSAEKDAAIKAAMIAELGNGRLEDLPMEDGEGRRHGAHESRRVYSHPPALAKDLRPVPVNKKWGQAIERGAFDDDDAAQVAGMDAMANGNLARQRRAGNIAFNHVSQHYSEKSLRRDQNGHVAPKTNFAVQGRATRLVPGKIHVGDGPIDIEAMVSSARPAGLDRLVPRGPAHSQQGSSPMRTQRAQPQPPARTPSRPVVSQPVAARMQIASPSAAAPPQARSQTPKGAQSAPPPVQMRVALPDGASIFLKLAATIQSTTLPQGKSMPGSIFLITGREPSEDMIVFAFDDKNVAEVRHRISEYTDYMTKEDGLMLLFTVSGGWKLFYAVVFEHTGVRESFIESLRKLVDRPSQEVQSAASASLVAEETTVDATHSAAETDAPQPLIKIDSPEPTVRTMPVQHAIAVSVETTQSARLQVFEMNSNSPKFDQSASIPITAIDEAAPVAPQVSSTAQETEAVVAVQSQPAEAVGDSTRQPDPPIDVGPGLIKEMVSWVMKTVEYMRDCAPENLCFDTIRTIIQSTAAAVVLQRYPDFHKLSPKVRAQVVEGQCRPAVEKGFLEELSKNPALVRTLAEQDADNEDTGRITTHPQPAPNPQQDVEVPVKMPQKPSPPKYEVDMLIGLRGKAATPPGWLLNIDELTKATLPATQPPSRRNLAWDDPSHPHIPGADTQPTETVGSPFGDVSKLCGGQGGQASTIGQRREVSQATPAVAEGNAQAVGCDLPNDTAWEGGIAPFTGPIQRGGSNGLGIQGSKAVPSLKGTQSHRGGIPDDHEVEEIACFLSGGKPASHTKALPSVPSGLKASRHNIGGSLDHIGQKAYHFRGDFTQGSTYSKELSGLFENDLNQKVVQTTEDLRKLSLGN